ncbi:MAG: hypothetical protein ACRD4I_04085, partial [Candidatus Angelobacter sp.]
LVAVGINHPDFPSADAIIHADKTLVYTILLPRSIRTRLKRPPAMFSVGNATEPTRGKTRKV